VYCFEQTKSNTWTKGCCYTECKNKLRLVEQFSMMICLCFKRNMFLYFLLGNEPKYYIQEFPLFEVLQKKT